MVSDAHLQGEGVVDRKEVEVRDRVRDRDRRPHGMGQRGAGGGGNAAELVTVATGCAGVGVAQGWVSIMCVPPGSGP